MPGLRARASEMEHAIRHHIDVHFGEDPARYRRLSGRLEEILAEHKDNWEQQALFFSELIEEIKVHESRTDDSGSSLNRTEEALYGLVLEHTATDGVVSEEQGERIAGFGVPDPRPENLLFDDDPERPVTRVKDALAFHAGFHGGVHAVLQAHERRP